MIYVASPYSHENPLVVAERVQQVQDFCHWCWYEKHWYVYSPIAHWHPIKERHKECGGFKTFINFDLHMISKSNQLFVLCLEDWRMSIGVTAEIIHAQAIHVPVRTFVIVDVGRFEETFNVV